MSKKGLFAIDPRAIDRYPYESVEALAKEICDWVKTKKHPATIQTTYSWWAKAVISPFVGGATNWSCGFPEDFEIDEIFDAIRAEGLFVSYVIGYVDWIIVDLEEHDDYPPIMCDLP